MNLTLWIVLIGAIGLFFAGWECYLVRKSRESGLLVHLSEMWNSDEYIKARRVVGEHENNLAQKMKEYEEKNQENYFLIVKVGNYFEHMGILVDRKFLSRDVVVELFGDSIKYYYGLYKDYVTQYRQEKEPSDLYIYFEHLAKLSALKRTKNS